MRAFRLAALAVLVAAAPATQAVDPAPRGHWPLDETSGTAALDASGNGLNGTYGPAPAVDTVEKAPLLFPNAAARHFDGADDLLSLGSPAAFDNLSAFTVAAWIRPEGYGENNRARIADKADTTSPTGGWIFHLTDESANALAFNAAHATTNLRRRSAANAITMNAWQHVAVTWNGSAAATGARLYINGVEPAYALTGDAAGSRANDAAENLKIGNDKSGARTFDGWIDDVRVYPRVLSLAEVQYLAGGHGPPPVPTLTSAAQTPGVFQIQVSWTAVTTTPSSTIAYTVQRGPSSGGPWTEVASGLTGTTWTDTDVSLDETHFYRVLSSNVAGRSVPSNTLSVTVQPPPPRTNDHDEGLFDDRCSCGSSTGTGPALPALLAVALALALLLVRRL